MEITETHSCKSCGNQFTGLYCNQCGEKVVIASDRSFKKLISNILVAITFADNKVFKTLFNVVIRPGWVSREVTEGKTIRYLKPISLFFVLNLIYFLFPLVQLFNASLKTQLSTSYGKVAQQLIAEKMVGLSIRDVNAFQLMYDEKTIGYAKMLVIIFAIIASLPMNLLYKSSKRFFTDHVGLMIELACFNLFVNALLITLLARILPIGAYLDENAFSILFIFTNMYFLIRAGSTFYESRGWKLILKSMIMLGFLKVALEVYRFILFLVTIWTL
jgi:hypothetical protein